MRLHGHQIDDLHAAADIDLGYLADDVVELQAYADDPDYAAGVAVYEGVRDQLAGIDEVKAFVPLFAKIAEGRFLMERVRAHAEHRPRPQSPTPCLFDPSHGPADHFVAWTPDGKEPRTVPACASDAALVEGGEQPEPRLVVHDKEAIPFWSAPKHFAYWFQGYFGSADECYPVRLLDGFPLGEAFAEPSSDDGVITADELFTRQTQIR
jgi:hypothetical protein